MTKRAKMFWSMVILQFFVCFLATASSRGHNLPTSSIIGGKYAKIAQFPYQLSLQRKRVHICGAALISGNTALTAGHCTYKEDVEYLSVLAGTIDREDDDERIFVNNFEEHPKYNPNTKNYDISIVFLKKSFELSSMIKPIGIAKANKVIPAGDYATVSGWGVNWPTGDNTGLNTKFLKFVNIPIWKASKCKKWLPQLTSAAFCGGTDSGLENACAGDSGGPLVYKNKLFGVVSFGSGCGVPYEPVVYTSVSAHRLWITRKVLGLPQINAN